MDLRSFARSNTYGYLFDIIINVSLRLMNLLRMMHLTRFQQDSTDTVSRIAMKIRAMSNDVAQPARLLNLHIAIYRRNARGHPPPITIALFRPPEKNTRERDTRVVARAILDARAYRGKRDRRGARNVASDRFLSHSRIFSILIDYSCQRIEPSRATIISRQSPRKSSQRTGTTPPYAPISLMDKKRWDR